MIAFTSTVAPDGSCPGGCYPHVFVVNADGTNVRQLTDNSSSYNAYGEHHPVISPDGTMVAFLSNLNQASDGTHPPEVYAVNTDGSNLRQVTPFLRDPNISSDWGAYMTGMAWSPDSKSLAFRGALWTSLCGTYNNNPAFNTAIGTIGADGNNLQVLTCDGNDGYVDAIDWSPDGSLLAWNRNVNHCAQGGSGCAGEPAMAFHDFTNQNRYSAGITSAQLNTDSCQGDVRCIHFSLDGTQLAYRNTLANSGGCVGQCYLSIISLDGSTRADTTVPAGGDFWWMPGPTVPAAARMTLDPQVLEFWPGFSRQLVPSLLDGGGNLIMHTANVFTNPFLYAQMCQPQIGPYGLMTSTIYPGNNATPAELNASNAGQTSSNVPFSCWPSQPCTYSLASSSENFSNSGGQGSVGVIADPGQNQSQCPWNATSSAAWIMITSPAYGEGAGSGSIGFTVAANGGGQRQGTITVVPGGTFTITQDAFNTVTLQAISVSPASASVAAGLTQQFTATGTYSDSSTADITSSVTWSSANMSIATISNTAGSNGLAKGVSAGGPITITATQGAISGGAQLTVTAAILQSITVTPAATSVSAGLTTPFTATGHYSDNSTQNLTASATWFSNNTSVAAIAATGVATGVKAGSTVTISATQGAISGTAQLTVTPPLLASIAVTPPNPSVPAGNTQQFAATSSYTDDSMQNITNSVSWASSNPAVATISSSGVASALAGGTTNISAQQGNISDSTSMTVITLQSFTIAPSNPSVVVGLALQFTATGHYSDGSARNLTPTTTWTSSKPTIATITSPGGLATGKAKGSTTIKAVVGGFSASTTLTVNTVKLVSISVTPTTATIPVHGTQQLTATGTYNDGSEKDITTTASWSTSAKMVASVNSSGLVTAGSKTGTAIITAKSGTASGSATLTVQ